MNAVLQQTEEELSYDVGSLNHSYLQTRLALLFSQMDAYTALTELSLDASHLDLNQFKAARAELRPDISVYPKREINLAHDILRMSEMPLLVIEILAPTQGIQVILDKFETYFALGVPSCWLVVPPLATVSVYNSLENSRSFISGEVIDQKLGLSLPLQRIFGQ